MSFTKIQKSKFIKFFAAFMALNLVVEIISPLQVYAITSGPSQPEVQSFEPVGTNQMVDVFSGDFSYNIPLLDVGGYPINISYHAGIGMEQDASWVGLGWNINPGVINRNTRGIPDDFNGTDKIKKTTYFKPERNLLLKARLGARYKESFGSVPPPDEGGRIYDVGIYYNNYKGVGFDFDYRKTDQKRFSVSPSFNTASGYNFTPSYGISNRTRISLGYNSTYGFQYASLSFNNLFKHSKDYVFLSGKNKIAYGSRVQNRGHSTSGISYLNPSYMPTSSPDMFSSSYDLNLKYGRVKSKGRFSSYPIDANYSVTGIREDKKTKEESAYGYFYMENAEADENGLMDFNRDNELTPNKRLDLLPTTILTHDIYSVSGQGTGGVFRPYRSRVGVVGDPKFSLIANVPNFGLGPEFGSGLDLNGGTSHHLGLDVSATIRFAASQKWDVGIFNNYSYSNPNTAGTNDYENWYFKSAGEKTVVDNDFYGKTGKNDAVWVQLDGANLRSTKYELGSTNGGLSSPTPQSISLSSRAKRNQPIFSLTGNESKYCLQKEILNYYTNTNGQIEAEPILRNDNNSVRKTHHVTEIINTNTDGSRYVYGLPAYNIVQKEVSFAIDKPSNAAERKTNAACNNKGIVSYSGGVDNSTSNALGIDNFFNAVETPPYAHSYLLTSVLSSDYVDIDNNGPSVNDLGNYTRFNYTKVADDYKWRAPYTKIENKAALMEGHKSDPTDDRAYYTYGEKEIWYMFSVETKTHIAEFVLNDPIANPRKDGNDAAGENGGVGTSKLRYLEKIVLYTREDREKNGVNATPVKTIYFQYTYELCKGTPYNQESSENGKLTLKRIWFTYGNTTDGALSPYVFTYSDNNPDYDPKKVDRWGSYKNFSCSDALNDDFPYATQDKAKADLNASAWNLTEIKLPSGGKIEVQYEADDYGYVQEKQAMEMFNVIGMGSDPQYSQSNNLLYEKGYKANVNKYIFFNLPSGVDATNIQEKLYPIENGLYFKFLVDLNNKGQYEYVTGYASLNSIGVDNSTGQSVGYVLIDEVNISDNNTRDASPIAKAAWQKTRVELPYLIHPETDKFKTNSSTVKQTARALLGLVTRAGQMLVGINSYMRKGQFAQKIKMDGYSVIRLKTPNKSKIGGGHRVKKILLHDEWESMTDFTEESQITGQVYEYTKKETPNSSTLISSGVATYEPILGGEENPHKYPVYSYADKRIAAINDMFQFEGPVGESYFPAPSVGYSQVTVRNIKPQDIGLTELVTRHGTGKSVYEFYTAYDFPVYSDRHFDKKDLNWKDIDASRLLAAVGLDIDYKALTQGFSIILNDMHGKPKAKYDYAEGDNETPIAFIKYKYKVEDENAIHKKLNNDVTVLNKDGSVNNGKKIGIETELVFDTQKDEEYGGSLGVEPNLNLVGNGPPPAIPLPVPTFFFKYSNFYMRQYRRVTATKLVNMYGVLDRVEVKEEGAVITTKNVAFDAETGEVLLTHTQNEYSDDIYNFSYPAHWAYDGMGAAYKNTGAIFNATNVVNGYVTVPQGIYDILAEGDELGRIDISTESRAWVLKKMGSNQILLIDSDGLPILNGTYQFRVIRSGRRNLQNTPIGSIVSNANIINTGSNTFADPVYFGDYVLNASATDFSDQWQLYADKIIFGKGAGVNTTFSTSALAYVGFMQNMIFSNTLLTNAEKIGTYVNSPGYNPHASDEVNALGYIYGISGISGNPPDLAPLEWAIQPNPDPNTLEAKIICSSGGPNCTSNPCVFKIKLYEPIYGYNFNPDPGFSNLLDITQDLSSLVFDENDNSINTKINVTFDPLTQTYHFGFYLLDIYGKKYYFAIETACVYYIPYTYCGFNYEGTVSSLVKDNVYNPFRWNVRGNWAPKRSLVYYDTRDKSFARKTELATLNPPTPSYNETNMRTDGRLRDFSPYWYKQGSEEFWTADYKVKGYTPWTWNSELTKKNPYGLELESKDALGIYSAAIYGNNFTLPIAVAGNSKLNEFCYEGFEEPYSTETSSTPRHFKFLPDAYDNCTISIPSPNKRVSITNLQAHTGKYSVKIEKKQTGDVQNAYSIFQSLSILTSVNDILWQWPNPSTASTNTTDPNIQKIQEDDVIKTFSPEPGEYVISYWVKFHEAPTSGTLYCDLKYQSSNNIFNTMYSMALDPLCNDVSSFNSHYNAYYLGKYSNGTSTYTTITTTPIANPVIINGWRREQLKFTVPANAQVFKIDFINTAENTPVYIDDIRIFPYDANMKSYAFDFETRRLMAELDENNYATFYEYDDKGNLVRVKRETDEGIITINENRRNISKK